MFSIFSNCALNYEKIKWNTERVSNIKPFTNKYNWKEINYPSINILYTKEKEIQLLFQKLTRIVKNK